jgi:hypothetical protein
MIIAKIETSPLRTLFKPLRASGVIALSPPIQSDRQRRVFQKGIEGVAGTAVFPRHTPQHQFKSNEAAHSKCFWAPTTSRAI